jgi:hypothetical protein
LRLASVLLWLRNSLSISPLHRHFPSSPSVCLATASLSSEYLLTRSSPLPSPPFHHRPRFPLLSPFPLSPPPALKQAARRSTTPSSTTAPTTSPTTRTVTSTPRSSLLRVRSPLRRRTRMRSSASPRLFLTSERITDAATLCRTPYRFTARLIPLSLPPPSAHLYFFFTTVPPSLPI